MSEAQSEAAKRAAARKAKILARGNSGLAKLAQTARGEEAETLYGQQTATPTPPSPAASASTSDAKPSWAPPPASSRPAQPALTSEQQAIQDQMNSLFGSFGGEGGQGMPEMSQLLSQMMGGGGPPGALPNLLGDLDDPAGLGGEPPNPFANGFPGMAGMPGMPGLTPPARRGKVDRFFPLIHFVAMILLALFAVVWWEPALRARSWGGIVSGGWARRWANLAGGGGVRILKPQMLQEIEVLPLFWAFTTVELILQTTRFMVLKSPPPPHSLVGNFLPLLPPAIARPLLTGSRYITLLSQTYKDGALLIFLIGFSVIVAQWIGSL